MAKSKHLSYQQALVRLEQYCSYQERCHQETRFKLVQLGVRGDALEEIMTHLIQKGFLDETRFASAYARGKLRNNQWGWNKIRQELKRRQISDHNLTLARAELEENDYAKVLRMVLEKKRTALMRQPLHVQKAKLFKFAYGRGFESELISPMLKEMLPKN